MNIKLSGTYENSSKLMSGTYCETLMKMAETDDRIMALDADLVSSSGMKPFFKAYPDRSINCGIQEANMIGVAAGLSATGKVPFAHTFGTFASRRVMDQVFMSCCYAKLNVRILGSDAGVTAAYNGGTHMPFEDMATFRAIPNITLIEPTDPVMLENLLHQLADVYGVYYLRMARKNVPAIYAEGSTFEIGKGAVLREGKDVTLIGSGILVSECLKAADKLAEEGISAKVIDMFTWKPIDAELIEASARETGAVVTAENHNTVGGLGSAVCEVLCQTCPVPVEMVGTKDRFGEVGTEAYLRKAFNMTPEAVYDAAKKAIARK